MFRRILEKFGELIEIFPSKNSSVLDTFSYRRPSPNSQPKANLENCKYENYYHTRDVRREYPRTLVVEQQKAIECQKLENQEEKNKKENVPSITPNEEQITTPGIAYKYTISKEQPPNVLNDYFPIVNYK